MKRRELWTAAAAVLAGLVGFWVTARDSDWFLDRPFKYSGPRFYSGNFLQAGVRGLSASEAVLGLTAAVFLIPAIVVASRGVARALDEAAIARAEDFALRHRKALVTAAAGVAAAGSAFVTFALVQGAAIIDDERAYRFEAELFARGHAVLPAPPAALRNPMFLTSPVWTSKYPPGNSLVLALGALVGDVRVVRPVLAALLVWLVYTFVASMFGKRQALAAAMLTALSPFVWAQYGTLMAFGTTACACAALLAGVAKCAETGRARYATLAGLALGWMAITRPHEALALGAPLGAMLLVHAVRGLPHARARALGVVLGSAAIVWILLVHNATVTGSALRFAWQLKVPFSPGFRQVYPTMSYVHTPAAAVANLVTLVARLDLWMLGYPASMLLVLVGLLRGERSPFDSLLAAMLGSFALVMTLVPSSGTWDCGPSYYFVCVPIFIAVAVRGWSWCALCASRFADPWLARVARVAPLVGLAVCWSAIAPVRFVSLSVLAAEIRAPWEFIAHAPYGDFLVALGSSVDRRTAGWAEGYPYEIATGPGTRAKLFYPHSDEEAREAIRALGPTLPVFRLQVAPDANDPPGPRVYSLVPLAVGPAAERSAP